MSTSTFRPGQYIGQQVRTDDGQRWQWTGERWIYMGGCAIERVGAPVAADEPSGC